MKCEECNIDYPPELVNPLTAPQGIRNTCGICALAISNRELGIKRERFTGVMAEAARQAALKWREQHPPKTES
jgi:hypothetical protein